MAFKKKLKGDYRLIIFTGWKERKNALPI